MSAAALRAPAGWRDAVRAQMLVLASVRPLPWIVLLLVFAGLAGTGEFPVREDQPPFGIFRFAVVMMFLLPLAWQGRRGAGVAPLPLTDGTRTVVPVFCGAAAAGLVFALGVGLYVIGARWSLGTSDGFNSLELFSPAYPVSLTLAGVANYLLGAALMLRAERPGRVLLAGLVLAALLLGAAGIELDHAEIKDVGSWEEERYTGGSSLTFTAALLRLLLGVAAVGAAAWWDARRSLQWRGWARRRTRLPKPARARPLPLAVPRAQASAATVFTRHLVLLAPRMVLPVLLAVYVAWVVAPGEVTYRDEFAALRSRQPAPAVITPAPLEMLWLIAFLWPVLVWLDERWIQPWDEAHPAGMLSRRLLHAAAGWVWLQMVVLAMGTAFVSRAVNAGVLASPLDVPTWLWLGLPVAMLMMYCLGTLATVGTGRPVLAGILWAGFGVIPLLFLLEMLFGGFRIDVSERPGPLSPTRLLTAVNWFGPETERWSTPLALLWTPVFVAAAALAIWSRAWRDQHGSSPSIREMLYRLRRAR